MMDPVIKAAWVKRLRSGEYVQGSGRLRSYELDADGRSKTFCCLGVLCALAVDAGVINEVPHTKFLPTVVAQWAGIESINPSVGFGTHSANRLAALNDAGFSFDQIANLIERDL